MKKTLVTTALESTWPKNSSVLFLGTWCCSFSRKAAWSSLDYEILEYHWDDRKKLFDDYNKLNIIYENYLSLLTETLNKHHKTNHSSRFWRILIGPWLYTCIHVLYDRWFMLRKALKNQNTIQLFALDVDINSLNIDDMDAFNNLIETDEWNEALYSHLIKFFFASQISIKYVNKNKNKNKNKNIYNKNRISFSKKSLINLSNKISYMFSGKNDVFLIGSHLSFFKLLSLQFYLKQFPSFWFRSFTSYTFDHELSSHRKNDLKSKLDIDPDFEAVLNGMLMKLLPKVYLEGFKYLSDPDLTKEWPKKPNAIFTSNSYASDDLFKYWAGLKVDHGAKLIIGQHGGNFGMTKMAAHENHQIKISDKFLSWGWKDYTNPKVIPVGNFKSSFKKLNNDPNGDALMAIMTLPKFSYYLYSVPIAGQIIRYFDDQLNFADALPKHIRKKLRIRLYPLDRGWDQEKMWKERFKEVAFDKSNMAITNSLRASRIFIGTYNATTYLETFSCNMPSILFWNPSYWETNPQTEKYFEQLRRVGILHNSPKSAAKHLIKIWNNIDDWWYSLEVQSVISEFNACYTWQNPSVLCSIKENLKI